MRSLTRRQAILAAGACVLCAAVAAAALTGNVGLALTLLAVFFTILFGGLLLIARRISGLARAQRRQQNDVRAVLDQTQRRLLGAMEELLLHSGDRHRELDDSLAGRMRDHTRDIEAIVQLFQRVTPRAPMPPAHAPADLLDLLHLIRTRKPRFALELGSGTATIWLAYAMEQVGGRLVSLHHDADRAEQARASVATHALVGVAEVREAPLRPVTIADRSFPWYDLEAVADVHDVDLLVIDGPPASTGPDARFPALPLLTERLADAAAVFAADAGVHGRWLETTEGLTREGEALLSYRRVVRQLSRSQ
ncbi:class I SAM-dependent methyltransferase [Actinoplanes sp. LDG1-06]|uniref:Class I SAM-dependent methyltransferase n=1 Tax=Paractinoplanes ovalisporus TaxID=2810368 RepID=A0ABS2ACP0_9ACTN|nr:class I SAM-dependent methyltransferase [Actinoplanes ovalisporus]